MLTLGVNVPFFFFLAGYFAKSVSGVINWRRGKEIFISMLLWCVIGYFWFGALAQLESGQKMDLCALLNSDTLEILGPWNSVSTPGSWDCWFLKVLIPLVLISGLLMRLSTPVILGVAGVSFLVGFSGYRVAYLPYFFLAESVQALAFYTLGIVIRRFVNITQLSEGVGVVYYWFVPVTVVLAGVGIVWHQVFDPTSCITMLWGLVYILSLSKLLCSVTPKVAKWFASFGPGVFFIYMVQEMLVIQCRWYFTVHPVNKHVYVLTPFAIFALLMLGYFLIRRYMPWACGVLCLLPDRKKG